MISASEANRGRREAADDRRAGRAERAGAEGPGNDGTGPEREGRDGDERHQAQDLLGPAIASERIGDEPNIGARADAPTPPVPAQHGLAVDLEDGRQALAELPAILAIARRPAGAAQERRHGLARPGLGARDLKAGHHEMPDDGGRTRSAAIAARARLRHWQRRMFLQ